MERQRFLRSLSKKSQKFVEHIDTSAWPVLIFESTPGIARRNENNVIPEKVEKEWFCNEYKTRRDQPRTFRQQLISRLSKGAKIFLLMYAVRNFLLQYFAPVAFMHS